MNWLPSSYPNRGILDVATEGADRSSGRDADRAFAPLTLSLRLSYHTQWHNRRRSFHAGPRPDGRRGAMTKRAWVRYVREKARGNPIRIADRFVAHYELPSVATCAEVATHFGVTSATVSHYMALVERLPTEFVEWLRAVTDPDQLRSLTERRLRPITRIADADEQEQRLQALARGWR